MVGCVRGVETVEMEALCLTLSTVGSRICGPDRACTVHGGALFTRAVFCVTVATVPPYTVARWRRPERP